jgi:hypothetical protein
MSAEFDEIEGEVIIAESPGSEPGGPTRTIRVYDKARGDFTLELPSEASVTFGYFNPAASGMREGPDMYAGRGGGVTMKATALRIYRGATAKSGQLACFLGVEGFRDLSLKLTRLRQRVVIESNFEDDGDGNEKFKRDVSRQLTAKSEDDVPF